MRLLTNILPASAGLLTGVLIWSWYLGHLIEAGSTAHMLLFIPVLCLYTPTTIDCLTALLPAAAGFLFACWAVRRLTCAGFGKVLRSMA